MVGVFVERWLATGAAEVIAATIVVAEQLGLGCLLNVNLILRHDCAVEILRLGLSLCVDGWNHRCAERESYHEFLHNSSSIVTVGGKSFVFAHK